MKKWIITTFILLTISLTNNIFAQGGYVTARDSGVVQFNSQRYLDALNSFLYANALYSNTKYPKDKAPQIWIHQCQDSLRVLIVRIQEQKAKAEEETKKAQQLVDILMPFEAKENVFNYFWKKGKTELQNFNYKEAYTALLFAKNAENIPDAQKDSVKNLYADAEWYNDKYSKATEYFYSNNFEQAKPLFLEIYNKNKADSFSLYLYKASFEDMNENDMVKVEGGEFTMGDDEYNSNYIEHQVKLTTFYISKYEVTNAQYARFLNQYATAHENEKAYIDSIAYNFIDLVGSYSKEMKVGIYMQNDIYKVVQGYENRPAAYISWYGANAYCQFYGGSLPTEAQWEYAASGGCKPCEVLKTSQGFESYIYAGSNNINSVAWHADNSGYKTHAVGTKIPNQLGIYDMSGNLWEWCLDYYSSDYYETCKITGVVTNPAYMQNAGLRILRGGSWDYYGKFCRTVDRSDDRPVHRYDSYGFRFLRNM